MGVLKIMKIMIENSNDVNLVVPGNILTRVRMLRYTVALALLW